MRDLKVGSSLSLRPRLFAGATLPIRPKQLFGPNLTTWTSLTATMNLSNWPKNGRGISLDGLGRESMVFGFKLEPRFWPSGQRYAIILHCALGRRCKHNVEQLCNSTISLLVKWIKPLIQTLILNCDDAISKDGSGVQDF